MSKDVETKGLGGPKYPQIRVKLVGTDGNAFSVLGKVRQALKRNGCTPEEINEFTGNAMSGDYDHLLEVCMDWVNVE